VSLDAPAGQTLGPLIQKNLPSDPLDVSSLGIAIFTKVLNAWSPLLDVYTYHVMLFLMGLFSRLKLCMRMQVLGSGRKSFFFPNTCVIAAKGRQLVDQYFLMTILTMTVLKLWLMCKSSEKKIQINLSIK
jgi:hypothetical protein